MSENEIKLTKLAKCAGCGAKVGAGVLAQLLSGVETLRDDNLIVGFDRSDDAAVYRVSDELAIVQTVDFFPPVADDPYLFGQIAAANALSDIYAMGGEPRLALNLLCVPERMPDHAVREILRGGYEMAARAGAVIAGGHSIFDDEPKYGLCVTGFVHPDRVITNSGARPGDALILTKALGVGIIMTAAKAELAPEGALEAAFAQMTVLNRAARDVMVKYRVHACTDVTGFGLMGHACEMAQGSNAAICLETAEIPMLEGAAALARDGMLPAGMYRNREFAEKYADHGGVPLEIQDVLYDPQSSGGLLIAVHPDDAQPMLEEMKKTVPAAKRIGTVCEYSQGAYIRLIQTTEDHSSDIAQSALSTSSAVV